MTGKRFTHAPGPAIMKVPLLKLEAKNQRARAFQAHISLGVCNHAALTGIDYSVR